MTLWELDDGTTYNIGIDVIGEQGNWTDNAAAVVCREITKYKLSSSIKICILLLGKFNCPLDWWVAYHIEYIYLPKPALKYLAIPETSAPLEHVFFAAGLTIAKDRVRLDPDRANVLVFFHDLVPVQMRYNEFVQHQ